MISHNEVDTHLRSGHNTQRNFRNAILIEFTSAQTITEEQDSKHQLPVVT